MLGQRGGGSRPIASTVVHIPLWGHERAGTVMGGGWRGRVGDGHARGFNWHDYCCCRSFGFSGVPATVFDLAMAPFIVDDHQLLFRNRDRSEQILGAHYAPFVAVFCRSWLVC